MLAFMTAMCFLLIVGAFITLFTWNAFMRLPSNGTASERRVAWAAHFSELNIASVVVVLILCAVTIGAPFAHLIHIPIADPMPGGNPSATATPTLAP